VPGHVMPGSVELWGISTAELSGTEPPAEERFALADVESPDAAGVVRMVTLHLRRGEERDRSETDFAPPGVRRFDQSGPQAQADIDAMPRARRIDPARAFPGVQLDELADELLRDLEARLLSGRRRRLPGETRLRPKERTARIELCEVALPAARPAEAHGLRFAAGCCRHPGMGFDRERADRALAALAQEAAGERLDLALMLGDQIYADATAGVIDAEDRLEKYTSRYYEAFDAPGFRRLARRLPLYMVGDDHEIRDNWPKDSVPPGAAEETKALFTRVERWAGQLFLAHQRSHGPDQPPWAPPRDGAKFWYAFEAGGLPFFCFDTRFERRRDSERMMEPYQLDCFRAWLATVCSGPNRLAPKFILSGSVFAPTEREYAGRPAHTRRADSWAGYPAERSTVLHEIMLHGAQNVVFVSGDMHCGAVASLHFPGNGLRCYSVVAPPFYAPFPFANLPPGEVAGAEAIETIDRQGHLVTVECRARSFGAGGFAHLAVEPPRGSDPLDWEIRIEYYADGWNGDGHLVTERRQLAILAGGSVTL